jgi:hypothetical protein
MAFRNAGNAAAGLAAFDRGRISAPRPLEIAAATADTRHLFRR